MQNQNQHTDGNPPIFNAYPQQDQRYNLYDNNMGGQNNLHAPQQQYNYQPRRQIIQSHSYNQEQNPQLPTQNYLQEQSHFNDPYFTNQPQSNKRQKKERQRSLQPLQGNRNAEFVYVGVNNTGFNQIPMPRSQTDEEQGYQQQNWDVIVGVSPSRGPDKSPARNKDPASCCLGFYILDQSMCTWIVNSFYYVMICPFKIIQYIFGGLWRTCCAQLCSGICPSFTIDFTSFCQIIESTCCNLLYQNEARCFDFVLKGSNNFCGSICFCCKNDCTGQILCNFYDSFGKCFGSIFECFATNLSALCECLLSKLSTCFECFTSILSTCCECFASYLSSCCECCMTYCEMICEPLGRCCEFILNYE